MLLITVTSGPDAGQTYRLSEDVPHLIGRHNGTVALGDAKVSRRHAEITKTRGRFVVHDMGSSNGTFVNNRRITKPTTLKPGSSFQVGRTICEFRLVNEAGVESDPEALRPIAAPTIAPPAIEQTHQLLHEMRDLLTQFVHSANESTTVLPQPAEGASLPLPTDPLTAATQSDPQLLMRLDELLQSLKQQSETGVRTDSEAQPLPSDLAMKVDDLLTAVEKEGDAEAPAAQRVAELQHSLENDETRRQFSEKLDALLELASSVPLHTEARSEALERKLDDLMAIVASNALQPAATTLPVLHPSAAQPQQPLIVSPAPSDLSGIEGKLDTLLQTIQVQQSEGVENQLAAAMVAAAQSAAPAPGFDNDAMQDLLDQLRLRIDALDQRVMQHVNHLSETAESQLRKTIGELTEALRGFSKRSDRALLEQLLHEIRGQNSQSTQETLMEIRARVRQLATADPQPQTKNAEPVTKTSTDILAALKELQAQQQAHAAQLQRLMDYLDSADPMALERV